MHRPSVIKRALVRDRAGVFGKDMAVLAEVRVMRLLPGDEEHRNKAISGSWKRKEVTTSQEPQEDCSLSSSLVDPIFVV